MPELFKMLDDEVQQRSWGKGQAAITRLVRLYEGELPPEYQEYFPSDEPRMFVNTIRLAWDSLARDVGRQPELRGVPQKQTDKELKRIGMLERIGYHYADHAEPRARQFYWNLGWWILTGRAVAIVKPGIDNKVPVMAIRDPRSAYPSAKRMVGRQIVELDDIIFKYEISEMEAKQMGLKTEAGKSVSTPGRPIYTPADEDKRHVTVIEMIDNKRWMITSSAGGVQQAEHGLDRVPAHVFQTHSAEQGWGVSQFDDQIDLAVGITRLLTLKIAYAERLTYPVYWAKGHTGEVKIGPLVINKLDDQGEMGQLAPPTTLQADRDIELLSQFSRILNRNPEVRQGEVDSSTYTSAKTLDQLDEAIDNTVSIYWDHIATGMEYLYSVALQMDEALWPNTEKTLTATSIRGNRKNATTYIPSEDIDGSYDLSVDYGFGLGGYQGFLQRLQAKEAGLMPKRQVIEDMPGVSDVEAVMRQIELERLDEAAGEQVLALAQAGALDLAMLAKMREMMAKEGIPLAEVALKVQEEMQQQAQDNLAATGGLESAMTVPQAGGAMEPGQPPGLPPLAALGG